MIATLWEVWNDAKGDIDKAFDVFIRVLLFTAEGVLVHWISHKPLIDCIILSFAIFFLCFDYLISYVLIKNGTLEPPRGVTYHWFSYTAKVGVIDNIPFWKQLNPWIKFGIRLIVFIGAIIIFVI